MKNIFKIITVFMLVLGVCCASVSEYMANEGPKCRIVDVQQNGYVWRYQELEEVDKSIVRIYNCDGVRSKEETKNLLVEMGLEEKNLNRFTDEELDGYVSASTIITTVSYSKISEKGEIVCLDEETAVKEAAVVNMAQEANRISKMNGIATATYDIDVGLDSYMKITYSVSVNGERCESIVIGEWLTMPIVRQYDSIGACAKYITVTPNTASCRVYYDETTYVPGKTTIRSITKEISDIQIGVKSGWTGIAATYLLPSDSTSNPEKMVLNTKFAAIFKYMGKIELPDQRLNFNAIATYSHMTFGIQFSAPGISISTSGADASIGMSIIGKQDKRSVVLEINYIPS